MAALHGLLTKQDSASPVPQQVRAACKRKRSEPAGGPAAPDERDGEEEESAGYSLVVYWAPDGLAQDLFHIANKQITETDRQLLDACHGLMVSEDGEEEPRVYELDDALCTPDGKWHTCRMPRRAPDLGGEGYVTHVYQFGTC